MFLVFPYFMEAQIVRAWPALAMTDYKVDYCNHDQFQAAAKGGRSLNSPVRIFTNVAGDRLTLPVDEGYRYCSSCARWTSPENRHCPKCNACTSKVTIRRFRFFSANRNPIYPSVLEFQERTE